MAILKKESPFPNDYLDIHVRFLGCILNTSCWSPKRSPHTQKILKNVQITTNHDHFGPQPTLLKSRPVFGLLWLSVFFVFFFSVEANLRVAELLLEQNKETEVEGGRGRRGKKNWCWIQFPYSFLFIPRGKQSNLTNSFLFRWVGSTTNARPTKASFLSIKKRSHLVISPWLQSHEFSVFDFQGLQICPLYMFGNKVATDGRKAGSRYWWNQGLVLIQYQYLQPAISEPFFEGIKLDANGETQSTHGYNL